MTNLSNILRPNCLDDFIGQSHIISKDKALHKLIIKKDIPHMFFYGPAGTGKTTLAKIISKTTSMNYYYFNATSIKIEELRNIFKKYTNSLLKPLIFIDEIHRLSTTQQEVLLPIMENYSAIIIGASTKNPFSSLTNGIRSRSFLYEFKSLNKEELSKIILKAKDKLNITIQNDAKEYLIHSSNGDARALLNLIDFASKIDKNITKQTLIQLRPQVVNSNISNSTLHYDLISAMIKSLRGSDIDASLYYLARLIKAGEDPNYIARRLVIFASEDISNANPNALNIVNSTMQTVKNIGYPESSIIMSQCVVYLASSPKSNSSYKAIKKALKSLEEDPIQNIPNHLRNSSKDYTSPHNSKTTINQKYINHNIKLYESNNIGYEKILNEWINKIKHHQKESI